MNLAKRRQLAARLDAARRAQHLSIRELARITDVPPPTLQGWLNGRHFPVPALRPAYLRMVERLGLADEISEDLWDERWSSLGPQLRTGRPPYLGLRPYDAADAPLFFGRRDEATRLAQAILHLRAGAGHGLVAVVGASGSGKSSLLAAGLIGEECVEGSLAGISVVSIAVDELGGARPDAELVVIDQFESFFALDEGERAIGARALAELAAEAVVVIGLRADAFAEASLDPVIAPALATPFLVAPLSREQARQVIVGPAELSGVGVDDDLVSALLEDLAQPGRTDTVTAEVLPLLSNALLVTWAAGSGDRMTVSDYVHSGGVWSALQALAEEVYGNLPEPERGSVRPLFLRMIRQSGELVVREALSLTELDERARSVMAPFVDARLLTLNDDVVQISHDALLSNWSRLHAWLEESRADRAIAAQLHRAASVWVDSGRSVDALIPVDRLEVFAEWIESPDRQELLGPREVEFIEASRKHFASVLAAQQQVNGRLRRGRRLAISLTAAASVLAIIAGTLYVRGLQLQSKTNLARLDAQSRQVALEARSVRADDPNLMAQMALVAQRQAVTRQSTSALLDSTAVNVPLRWLGARNAVLAKTADDQIVARADGSGGVTIWRGAELTRTPGTTFHADPTSGALYAIAVVRFGPRLLLAVGGSSTAGLWDVTSTPRLLTDLGRSGVTVYGVAFNADGRRLAVAGSDGTVGLWSVTEVGATSAGSVSLGGGHPARAVTFSPASGELFVAGLPDAVAHFTAASKPRRLPDLGFAYAATPVVSQALAVSPDGAQLVAGIEGRRVPRWDISGKSPVAQDSLTGFLSWTNDLSYSADGKRLILANSDKNTYLYDAATAKRLDTLSGATIDTGAEIVAGRPVTTGDDGVLRVWQAHNPVLRTGSTIYSLSTDASTRFLAASTIYDGQELWNTSGAEPVRLPNPDPAGRSLSAAVAVAPSARFMVGGTTDGSVLSWPLTASGAGKATSVDAFSGSYIGYLAVSPDSSLVAAQQYTGTQVALYRADATGRLSLAAKLDAPNPQAYAFSPDSDLLAVPIGSGTVQLWDVSSPTTPKLAGKIEGLDALPPIVAFANHSRTLAVGTDVGQVTLWDVTDPGKPVEKRVFGDPHGAVYGITFSPDDSTLAAVGGDTLVWVWHVDGPASAFLSLDGSLGNSNDVRFLNGGQRLAAGGDAGILRLWTADPGAAEAQLCANRGDVLTTDEWDRFLPGVTPEDPC